jgi:DNA invertase Pin-like site-specific DNA recombinase
MVYGYARVSTKAQESKGNSLETQDEILTSAGAQIIYCDTFTGVKTQRPELTKLLSVIKQGDTLIVTKLDRIARSLIHGSDLINDLIKRGIIVNILNLGVMDDTASSKLIRSLFLAFAEFERDMIYERTREGKEKARLKDGFKEGRPRKFTDEQIRHALWLNKKYSLRQVSEMTNISTATIKRYKNRFS